MSADGVKKFIAAVDLIYPAPQYDGDKVRQGAWLSLMVQTLGGCSDEVLAASSAHILRKRDAKKDGRFFPTLNECIKITQEVAEDIERLKVALLEHKKPDVPYDRRCVLARDIMQSPLGQQAKRECWDTTMFQFCVEHMRAPQGREIDTLKRTANAFKAEYERLLKAGCEHPFSNPLTKLADGIVRSARRNMGDAA